MRTINIFIYIPLVSQQPNKHSKKWNFIQPITLFLISEPRNENNQHIYIRINMHINCTDLEWTWQKHDGAHCSQSQSEQKLSWQQPKWRRRKRTQKPKTPSFANLLYLTHSVSHCSHSKQTEPNFQDLGSTKKTKKDSNFYSLITIFFSPPPIVSDGGSKNEMRDFIGKRLVGAKTIKIERVCECERVTWWVSDGD